MVTNTPTGDCGPGLRGVSSTMMSSYRTSSQTFSQNSPCKSFLGASEYLAFSKALFWCCVCFSYTKYLIVNLSPCSRLMHSVSCFLGGVLCYSHLYHMVRLLSPYLHPPTQPVLLWCSFVTCSIVVWEINTIDMPSDCSWQSGFKSF